MPNGAACGKNLHMSTFSRVARIWVRDVVGDFAQHSLHNWGCVGLSDVCLVGYFLTLY